MLDFLAYWLLRHWWSGRSVTVTKGPQYVTASDPNREGADFTVTYDEAMTILKGQVPDLFDPKGA